MSLWMTLDEYVTALEERGGGRPLSMAVPVRL